MPEQSKIQIRIEAQKLLRKTSTFISFCALIFAFAIFLTAVYNDYIASDSFGLILIPFIVILILSAGTALKAYFEEKAAQEEDDRAIIEKRHEKMALDVNEDALFQWNRSKTAYNKYAPYVITILAFIAIAFLEYFFWTHWNKRLKAPELKNELQCVFAIFMMSIISVFSGVFCIGQSREKYFRWLRPVGAWLILVFLLGTITGIAILLAKFGFWEWTLYSRKISLIVLAILGAEFLLNFVIEFYRPRTAFEDKPLFESRLLSLLTEPGGVVRNLVDTLDYQFGFRISKADIYMLVENSILPLVLAWLAALWLFTSVVEVKSNELGIRENFGVRVKSEPLQSGIYLKYPWPFAKISKFPVYEIQEIMIGPEMKDEQGRELAPDVVLWTKKHYTKEPRFIVASDKEEAYPGTKSEETPISFLAAFFPLQFKIRKDEVVNYGYIYKDAPKVLADLANREITKYLASADMQKVMSTDRMNTVQALTKNIQNAADKMKLGVDIVCLNFLDAHPPIEEVAPSYQEVVGAFEQRETKILKAKAYKNKVILETEAEVNGMILASKTDANNMVKIAEAEKERYMQQLDAYRRMPQMFKLRYFLDFFDNDLKNVRKIVVDESIPHNVFILNLEEKARLELTDLDLLDLESKKTKNSSAKSMDDE